MTAPILVACAHGTDNQDGRAVVSSIIDQARALLNRVTVVETYVDVQSPQLPQVLGELDGEGSAVVVPLLLSGGYHVHHDIACAVVARNQSGAPTRATNTLGPHQLLAQVQRDRIAQAASRFARGSSTDICSVILVAAGSSDGRAQQDVERQAQYLADATGAEVSVAYLSAAQPTVEQAVAQLVDNRVPNAPLDYRDSADQGPAARPIVLSSFLLAPGFFHTKLQGIAADLTTPEHPIIVTEPLGSDPRISQIVAERYRGATLSLAKP